MINLAITARFIGMLLGISGLLQLTTLGFSFYYNSGDHIAIIASAVINLLAGATMMYATRNNQNKRVQKRDGFLIVTMGWLMMTFFGTLPYVFSGAIPNYTDAFFETMSGFTTTGATILTDIEALPEVVLFWLSMTQWIGGMGIIVLAVAILPILSLINI